MQPRWWRGNIRITINGLSLIYPGLLLGMNLLHLLKPQRNNFIALTEIFAPYLFGPLLVLLPVVLLRGTWFLRVALLLCSIIWVVRFAPHLPASAPAPDPDAIYINAMTWNVLVLNQDHASIRRFLATGPANIVALQETEANRLSLRGDSQVSQVYPYQLSTGPVGSSGLVLLSTYPIVETSSATNELYPESLTRLIWARLDLGHNRFLRVVTTHPYRARGLRAECGGLLCFDPTERDREIQEIHRQIVPFLQSGEPLLLMGDFNVTEREPAYAELTVGLQDVYARVGGGWGGTWGRIFAFQNRFALLRIDYILASPNLKPLTASVDCTLRGSDHCLLHARLEIK